MSVIDGLRRDVERRAAQRCEYCRMHQSIQGAMFHLEHVLPRSRTGKTSPENLAWACPACNLHKADRVEVIDAESQNIVPLFNPRADRWDDHFQWDGFEVVPLTPVGRATADALRMNHPRRLQIRQAESLFSLFPP